MRRALPPSGHPWPRSTRGAVRFVAVLALVAVVAAGFALWASGAVAVFPDSNVTDYAACFSPGPTSILGFTQIAVGDTPAHPCGPNQVVVHLSGGDITAVRTPPGSGLTGGTENGAATLSLASGYSLPQSNCSTGQVPRYSGGNWTCGTVAGANQSCSTGEFANAIGADGSLGCATTPGPNIWTAYSGDVILDKDKSATVDTLSLPAGTYFVLATGNGYNTTSDNVDLSCIMRTSYNGEQSIGGGGPIVSGSGREGGTFSSSGIASSTSSFSVGVGCNSFADDNVVELRVTAILVGNVTDQSGS